VATITEWLASLGLSEYAKRFTESDIDVSVLRHLTDQDLKELGVSLGHRRKMLAATAELAGAAALPPTHLSPEPKRRDNAERRQLTVNPFRRKSVFQSTQHTLIKTTAPWPVNYYPNHAMRMWAH
jgi:hypothetical protein